MAMVCERHSYPYSGSFVPLHIEVLAEIAQEWM